MTPAFKSTVETLFDSAFKLIYPTTHIIYANTPIPDTQETYVCLHIMASEDTFPTNLGYESKSRNVGLIQVDVFAPKDRGSGVATQIAYNSGSIFKRRVISTGPEGTITFKDPSLQDRGEVHSRHKCLMRIPYRYDYKGVSV